MGKNKSIEHIIIESIENQESKFNNDKLLEAYEKTSNEFEELVKAGFTKYRGHNLLSPSDNVKVSFNTKK